MLFTYEAMIAGTDFEFELEDGEEEEEEPLFSGPDVADAIAAKMMQHPEEKFRDLDEHPEAAIIIKGIQAKTGDVFSSQEVIELMEEVRLAVGETTKDLEFLPPEEFRQQKNLPGRRGNGAKVVNSRLGAAVGATFTPFCAFPPRGN